MFKPYRFDCVGPADIRAIDARTLTLALSGTWHRSYGTAPCPVCQRERRPEQTALTLADGRVGLLAHCKKSACTFADVLAAASVPSEQRVAPDAATLAEREGKARAETDRTERRAMAIWEDAVPVTGSLAERYLRGRGITCDLPSTLRFHPTCWHPTVRRLPALVALVEGSPRMAIHRTYLRADGSGKADIAPSKAMLGRTRGGAVRLTAARDLLVVAEGIETALSLACLAKHPSAIWAALSTSGLRGLNLPADPGQLIVAPDGDEPGRSAAQALADRARKAGWRVAWRDPGDNRDWNDVLRKVVRT